MTRPPILRVLSGGLLLALSLPATAQRQGEVTFYSEIAFRGQSFTVTGPRANPCAAPR
jgi:hypothetical protein